MFDSEKTNDNLEWDLEIDASHSSRNFGFSGMGNLRYLVLLLAKRDFITVFKQSILGPAWLFIQPSLKVAIYYLVFGKLMKVQTDGVPPILFYLTGLFFWELFASNVKKIANAFIANQHVLSKVYFNRLAIPLSQMLANFVRSSVLLILLLAVWLFYLFQGQIEPNGVIWVFPILVVVVSLFGAGCGMLIASFTKVYRDFGFALESLLQILFYLTPVVYPITLVGENVRPFLLLNPLVSIFETIKYGLLGAGSLDLIPFVLASLFSIAIFFIGIRVFQKTSKTFVDRI